MARESREEKATYFLGLDAGGASFRGCSRGRGFLFGTCSVDQTPKLVPNRLSVGECTYIHRIVPFNL